MILVEDKFEESRQDSKVPHDSGYHTRSAAHVLQPIRVERGPKDDQKVAPQIDISSTQEGERENTKSSNSNYVQEQSELEAEGLGAALLSKTSASKKTP